MIAALFLLAIPLAVAALCDVDPERQCAVGRAVIADLYALPKPGDHYDRYVDPDAEPSLVESCPDLIASLPAGIRIADAEARKRATHHGPQDPGHPIARAMLYHIAAPVLSADGRAASVTITYECTGLCGLGMVVHYRLDDREWVRTGEPEVRWVS